MRYLLSLFLIFVSLSAKSANVDYRALLLQYFTTNGFYVGLNTNTVVTFGSINTNAFSTNGTVLNLNTNFNSVLSNYVFNLVQASPQVWTTGSFNTEPVGTFAWIPGVTPGPPGVSAPMRVIIGISTNTDATLDYGLFLPGGIGGALHFRSPYPAGGTNVSTHMEWGSYGFNNNTILTFNAKDDGTLDQSGSLDFELASPSSSSITFTSAPNPILSGAFISDTNGNLVGVFDGNGNLSYIRGRQYSWPSTNALSGQVWASDGASPQQLYWTNLPAGFGGVTNFATTNTSSGLTNAIVSIFGYQTNFITTNTSAGSTQAISSIFTNQIPNFIHGRTNYLAYFNPNSNEVSASILFQTNGTTDIGMRNGDSPDGSAALSLKLYGHYATEAARDWLDSKWNVANGDYEILTDKGSGGTARQLTFGAGGVRYWDIPGTGVGVGDWLPITSNARSIGGNSDGIKDIWIEGRTIYDQNGSAGVGQIGNIAVAIGCGINFQGQRIGFIDNNAAVDVIRFETATITPPSKRIVDIGPCILAAGTAAGSRNVWFGQDQLNTGNRWMMGTNNLAATSQPAANQLIGSAGSGSHIYGGDLGVYGGPSTGSGTNGALILGTAEGGAAISTLNTPKIRFFLAPEPVILTESSATLIGTISNITAGHFAGAVLVVTTDADDSTDFQCVNETFSVAMVNKGNTLTTSVSASAPSSTITSSGTLTTTITAVANVNGCDIKVNAVSSLTQTTLKSRWRIQSVDSDVVPHVYDSVGRHL